MNKRRGNLFPGFVIILCDELLHTCGLQFRLEQIGLETCSVMIKGVFFKALCVSKGPQNSIWVTASVASPIAPVIARLTRFNLSTDRERRLLTED